MFNIDKIRNDFPQLRNHPEIVYFDNAGTALKPQCVIDKVVEYYSEYCSNPHSEDNSLSMRADKEVNIAREKVAKFLNCEKNEIFFTSGDTASLNTVAYGLKDQLKPGDEVLLTVAEHASNVLPWFKLKDEANININYIELTEDGRVTLENVKKAINEKTKIISLAHITNVLGYIVDVKPIIEEAHKHGILVIIDGAQSVPHIKIDVKELGCDFLCFSGHKMCGPTGIGVVYGKLDLLKDMTPMFMGGGNNTRFDMCGDYSLLLPPKKFEAGTLNVAGILGLGAAIDYLEEIGMDEIEKREVYLKDYMIKRMKEVEGVKIYNENTDSGIITFNYKDVFAQDLATHLNSYGIQVRSGQHCAKILLNYLKTTATVRASLYFYNTTEEIDRFIEALKKGDEFLDAFFK